MTRKWLRPGVLCDALPAPHNRLLTWTAMLAFLVIVAMRFSLVWNHPDLSGENLNRPIPASDDSGGYQRLAVNLLRLGDFTGSVVLPIEEYHLEAESPAGRQLLERYRENGPEKAGHDFFRAPGFPFMLASAYHVFGNSPMTARRLLAALAGLTALIVLVTGAVLAGWVGAVAGGLAALYYLAYSRALAYLYGGMVFTELPATFWFSLFCLLLVLHQKGKRSVWLYASAVLLAIFVFTRANYLPAGLFFLGWLRCSGRSWRRVAAVAAIVFLPVIGWSVYASGVRGEPVSFTMQGKEVFPLCNNIDVLEGVGPHHEGAGYWQPGPITNELGRVVGYRNAAQPGENGYVKGLLFWLSHLEELPRLFYVKLRLGFWYAGFFQHDDEGTWRKFWGEGFYLVGIGFLLMSIGWRERAREPWLRLSISPAQVILLQLALMSLLFFFWNLFAFWIVLCLWVCMLAAAVLLPYGDAFRPPFVAPTWFLVFVASHAVATMLFMGVRYHWPLDPMLLMLAFLGVGMTILGLLRKHWPLAIVFAAVVAFTLIFRRYLSPEDLMRLIWSTRA